MFSARPRLVPRLAASTFWLAAIFLLAAATRSIRPLHALEINAAHDRMTTTALRTCSTSTGNLSPCTASKTVPTGATGQTSTFDINNNTDFQTLSGGISCQVTAPVTTCSMSRSTYSLSPGSDLIVTVTYGVSTTVGTGTVKVVTSGGVGVMTSTLTVTTTSSGVSPIASITPHTGTATVTSGSFPAQVFTLKNTGTEAGGFTFVVSCVAPATVCHTPSPISSLAAGATSNISVGYTAGSTGSGTIKLVAIPSAGTAKDSGTVAVTVNPGPCTSTSGVIAQCTNSASFTGAASGQTLFLTYHNTSSGYEGGTIGCSFNAPVTSCSVNPTSFDADPGYTAVIQVTYSVGNISGTGSLTVSVPSAGVASVLTVHETAGVPIASLTPHSGSVTVTSGVSYTQGFSLTNRGTSAGGFSFVATCSVGFVTCAAPASITSLAVGATATPALTYKTGTANGSVKLVAIPDVGTGKDSGAVTVNVPAVVLDSVSVAGVIARDHCLTISVGAGAAYECGDLRIVHALPSTRTKGLVHTPVLLYNSSAAHPYALVASNYTLSAAADSVVATVLMGGAIQGRGSWEGSDWGVGSTRRIEVGFDAITKRTGYYTDTLQIVRYASGITTTTIVAGELMIVNRSGFTADSAYFGRGWWVAGLEQLYNLVDGTKLWVGGDGSVRHFMKVVGISNVWIATLVDGTDGLNFDGTNYTRFLPHGLKVRFDASGKHIATVNRLGDSTIFRYDASGRLSAIKLYPDTTRQYVFQYDANGKLAVVLAPTVGGVARNDSVRTGGGLLTRIKGPDTTFVGFGYVANDTNLIATRTDRNGTVAGYVYGTGKKLTSFVVDPGFSQGVVALNFSPFETASLAGSPRPHAVIADSAFTILDGARRDTTLFWPDRIGGPNRVRNAMGFVTVVRRDTTWPGLAAWSRDPGGRVRTATYDSHGNPLTVVDSSTYDAVRAKYAVTTYTWDQLWDFVKRVKLPESEGQLRSYSSVTGNLLWEQPDSDSTVTTRRTTFAYNTSGAAKNLLASVNPPLSAHPDSLGYDNLGNVNAAWTELGFKSRSVVDDIGRVTSTVAPILTGDSLTTATTFNIVDEDVESRTVGKTTGTAWTDTLVVSTTFDREGQPLNITRRPAPVRDSVETLITRYRYDKIGRKIKEVSPNFSNDTLHSGSFDTWVYDAAGNDTAHMTRRGYTLRTTYDLLGRVSRRIVPATLPDSIYLNFVTTDNWIQNEAWRFPRYPDFATKHRVIPADTATFTYDAIGDMLTANNGDAKITRTYYANGQLATDESDLRTWATLAAGGSFTSHMYRDSITYDLDGRRKLLRAPSNIAPTAYGFNTPMTDITFSYDPVTGQLATVHDMMGNDFRLFYTAAGQADSIAYPGSVGEKFHYDGQHRLLTRLERGPAAYWTGPMHQDSMSYDMRDELKRAQTTVDATTNEYSLLGQLTQTRFGTSTSDAVYYGDWTYDALGNRLSYSYRTTPYGGGLATIARTYMYQRNTGRLWQSGEPWTPPQPNPPHDNAELFGDTLGHMDSTAYDRAGNQKVHELFPEQLDGQHIGTNISYSIYGADEMLRVFDQRKCAFDATKEPPCAPSVSLIPATSGAYEDYRYDALGRRVLLRSRYDTVSAPPNQVAGCTNPSGLCHSVIERYVWDGDQILTEIRMPGGDTISSVNLERDTVTVMDKFASFGRVTYVHSGVLDRPFAIIRNGYTYDTSSSMKSWAGAIEVSPHQSWRGKNDLGTYSDGHGVYIEGLSVFDFTNGHCRTPSSGGTVCMTVIWPELYAGMYGNPTPGFGREQWFGSLAQEMLDNSGQLYKRNRYYDPTSGRFTQEDPIGLAGGVNAYGFADGNPVSYGDPFGLCPGVDGTNPDSVEDCPDESTRSFWDRFFNGPRYITVDGKRVRVLTGEPIPIGGPEDAAEGLVTAAERGEAIEQLHGFNTILVEFFETGKTEGLTEAVAKAYRIVAKWAVEHAEGMDRSGTQARRLEQIEEFLRSLH